jgi:hypothetical protein
MIYLKSIVAGLVAVFSVAVLFVIGVVITVLISAKKEGEGAIGWDPIALVRPAPMILVLAIFVAGFLWEFRRASP